MTFLWEGDIMPIKIADIKLEKLHDKEMIDSVLLDLSKKIEEEQKTTEQKYGGVAELVADGHVDFIKKYIAYNTTADIIEGLVSNKIFKLTDTGEQGMVKDKSGEMVSAAVFEAGRIDFLNQELNLPFGRITNPGRFGGFFETQHLAGGAGGSGEEATAADIPLSVGGDSRAEAKTISSAIGTMFSMAVHPGKKISGLRELWEWLDSADLEGKNDEYAAKILKIIIYEKFYTKMQNLLTAVIRQFFPETDLSEEEMSSLTIGKLIQMSNRVSQKSAMDALSLKIMSQKTSAKISMTSFFYYQKLVLYYYLKLGVLMKLVDEKIGNSINLKKIVKPGSSGVSIGEIIKLKLVKGAETPTPWYSEVEIASSLLPDIQEKVINLVTENEDKIYGGTRILFDIDSKIDDPNTNLIPSFDAFWESIKELKKTVTKEDITPKGV